MDDDDNNDKNIIITASAKYDNRERYCYADSYSQERSI